MMAGELTQRTAAPKLGPPRRGHDCDHRAPSVIDDAMAYDPYPELTRE